MDSNLYTYKSLKGALDTLEEKEKYIREEIKAMQDNCSHSAIIITGRYRKSSEEDSDNVVASECLYCGKKNPGVEVKDVIDLTDYKSDYFMNKNDELKAVEIRDMYIDLLNANPGIDHKEMLEKLNSQIEEENSRNKGLFSTK